MFTTRSDHQINQTSKNRRAFILLISLILSATSSSVAQNGFQFRNWKPALIEKSEVKSKRDCGSLVSLTGYEFSIETASMIPSSGDQPAFCQVTGQIAPEVRFELSLPASWNNRFYMFGNGGYAGEQLGSQGRVATRNTALKAGFAVAQTNTGHDGANEPLGTFAVNRQKLIDYAFRAVHVTAETSKRLIREYYGAAAARSYFDGCSTGGRQGLISAQRFPDDFDGILVGAPVLDFTGTMTNYIAITRALEAAPIPLDKLKIIAQHVYSKCDGADGLADGLIDDPRRCDFEPAKELPICANDVDGKDCFTSGQIRALNVIYRGAESGGKPIFWGQPVGAEIGAPVQSIWTNWIIAPTGRSISYNFAETFFRYLAFQKPDPNYDIRSFNFETDLPRLQSISGLLDAKNADLDRFKSHGGKIVMYFGWADTALNPLMGVDYYEKVSARFGGSTQEFYRLFMVPGMAHCRGGVGADQCDFMSALVEWVEKNAAPNQIVTLQSRDGKPVRTRLLCPYPQVAKRNGNGNPDDAQSFVCANPEKRL